MGEPAHFHSDLVEIPQGTTPSNENSGGSGGGCNASGGLFAIFAATITAKKYSWKEYRRSVIYDIKCKIPGSAGGKLLYPAVQY
jgi:hypothetical protein